MPVVLKADGLALGKGVLICNTLEEARAGVKEIMQDKHFGTAGDVLVVEEFLTTPMEGSHSAICAIPAFPGTQ